MTINTIHNLPHSQLVGLEVEALKGHYEYMFSRGDVLTVYDKWGSVLKVKTDAGVPCNILVRDVKIVSEVTPVIHCKDCGSMEKGTHYHGCPVIMNSIEGKFDKIRN